jgi:Fe-S cluster biogenesis protein NfuA
LTEQANDLRAKVQATLEQVRPSLQADGGDVELIEGEGTVAKVRLQGACHGCPMAAMTLQMGIERVIKSQVPEITAVENVTED